MEEYIENERFNAAKEKIIGKKHNDKGIGTLSETVSNTHHRAN